MNEKAAIISIQILILFKEQSIIIIAKKNVNKTVYIYAKTIKNIFSNFIPHETITPPHDRDPPRISDKIKKLINEKNTAYQSYIY